MRISGPDGLDVKLPRLEAEHLAALRRLRGPGASEERIADRILRRAGADALTGWFALADSLGRRGALDSLLVVARRPVVRARYLSLLTWTPWRTLALDRRRVLSRFALLRRDGSAWTLETSRSPVRLSSSDARVLSALTALSRPVSARQLASRDYLGSTEYACQLLSLLDAAGVLGSARRGAASEDEHPDLVQWEFADALLHARSRIGWAGHAVGATWPHAGRAPCPPALKPPMSNVVLTLPKPSLAACARTDPAFTTVLEARRSQRSYHPRPIDIGQLSEFLYRAARVKSRKLPSGPGPRYEYTHRPSPGGGACHELELYTLVRRCGGIEPGLYHYRPGHHALEAVAVDSATVEHLLADARQAIGHPIVPQVLLIVSARFARVSWKYGGIAYATTLKNVGALFQTMYLVATAMGLAACAVGAGDSPLFARAIGTDPFAESSVGEFLLGRSRRPRITAARY